MSCQLQHKSEGSLSLLPDDHFDIVGIYCAGE